MHFNFNPRSREGSDKTTWKNVLSEVLFQSALPRGERHQLEDYLLMSVIFQSALPRGERLKAYHFPPSMS